MFYCNSYISNASDVCFAKSFPAFHLCTASSSGRQTELAQTALQMGDSILRKTDRTLSKGEDVVVCLPGARIEHVTERVENVLGHGQGGLY